MRRMVLGLAIAAALATAAPARAADGDPYVQSCMVVVRSTGCDFNPGLTRSPFEVAASPDGRQLYITTNSTPSVLQIVDRDPATGTLTPRTGAAGCYGPSGSGCTEIPLSVGGATTLAVSHDGRTLLVSAGGHVFELARDLTTGTLTYSGDATGQSLPGAAYAAAFSPDDRFVYVRTSGGLDALRTDGLTQVDCYTDAPTNGCVDVAGLGGQGYEIAVSQDVVAVPFFTLTDGHAGGGVAVFKRRADGTLEQQNGTSGGCVSVGGQVDNFDNQCEVADASLTSPLVVTISPDARFVYAGTGSAIVAMPLTPEDALQPPVAAASVGTVEDLVATNDALLLSTFGGVIDFFTAGAAARLPGTLGCLDADGSSGCTQLGGLDSGSQTHTFLAADPAGLNVYATSDTQGMLASIVRDYAPVCHGSSVTLAFETPTAIRPDCADPNGDPLTYTVTGAPRSGSLSGTFLYSPAAGFSGADQFSYIATGRGVSSAPVTVALGVPRPAPIAPAAPPVVVHTPAPRRTVGALVGTRWEIHGTRFSLRQLTLSQLPKTWTAQIRCAGRHCPFARRTLKGRAKHGTASVLGSLKRSQRRFRAGQTLEVWVSAPGLNTKVARLVLKKGRIPSTQALCAAPGAKKAASRCG